MLFRRLLTYRLMLYYLAALLAAALLLSMAGAIAYKPLNILFSTALMLAGCFAINAVFARMFGAVSNPELGGDYRSDPGADRLTCCA